jgi:hypothetical protein
MLSFSYAIVKGLNKSKSIPLARNFIEGNMKIRGLGFLHLKFKAPSAQTDGALCISMGDLKTTIRAEEKQRFIFAVAWEKNYVFFPMITITLTLF